MDYNTYTQRAREASDRVEAGKLDEALEILRELTRADISDLDKSVMWVNIAVVHDKAGAENEALAAYDEAIRYERGYYRSFAAETRAAYLHRLGRLAESLQAYETLTRSLANTEADKLRLNQNIATIRGQIG
jgi:tetratricopeptide (TPR) repeat protein